MMTARDAVSPLRKNESGTPVLAVGGGVPLLEVLPRLLDSPCRELEVIGDGGTEGIIDQTSMLEALGRMIAPRYDCSVIDVECAPAEYSASHIARAVEDADMHLVDLLSSPAADGHLCVTLRVQCEDPSPAVHSLERYGYHVTGSAGHEDVNRTAALERLMALQALINV